MHLSCAALVRALFFLPLIVPGQTANPLTQQTPSQGCPPNDLNCTAKKIEEVTNKANSAATKLGTAAESLNSAAKNLDTTLQNAAEVQKTKEEVEKARKEVNKAKDEVNTNKEQVDQAKKDVDKAKKEIEGIADKATASGILRRLGQRKGGSQKPPLNDYVPCFFDGSEDFDLRARSNPYHSRKANAPINQAEADEIIAKIERMLYKLQQSGRLTTDQVIYLSGKAEAAEPTIVGLPPAKASQKLEEGISNAMSQPSAAIPNPDVIKPLINPMQQTADQSVKEVTTSNTFDRPDDVVCAYSLMGWNETKDTFGRRVANDYVAIQVNVRNLSRDNEFLVHDIQLAVDTGVNPRQFGRFQTGRDRYIVRAVAQRGQSEDRRNLILNTMQMIGNIAGGASAAFTHATVDDKDTTPADKLSTAVELFQGPFITGLINIFPDHTLEHINHISDLVFSASSTNKTVIPIQGSVPLVTFLLERPLEQLPFSRCGTTIKRTYIGETWWPRSYKGDKENIGKSDDTKNQNDPGTSKYRFCQLEPDDDVTDTNSPEPDAYTKPLHYKKWNPAAIKVLEHRTYVVVAGVHIQEVSNAATVTSIKCPLAGTANVVDLSNPDKDGNITCNLEGKHLEKAVSARLTLKAKNISTTVEAASDGNTGTLTFAAKDFDGKNDPAGDYDLFVKDNAGNETDTKQSVKFGVRKPNITSVSPSTLPTTTPSQLTITGKDLDRISAVTLVNNSDSTKTLSGTVENQSQITAQTETMKVTFVPGKFSSVGSPAHVEFKTNDDDSSHKDPTNTQITIPQSQ